MSRVKGGPRAHAKHKKILKLAKSYRGTRSKLFKRANEAVLRAGEHAFAGRKIRRRDIRKLWIIRLNGALSYYNIRYNQFIQGLKSANIILNRKMLSQMAMEDSKSFGEVVELVRKTFK